MNNYYIERFNCINCVLLTLTGVYIECYFKVDTPVESIQDGRHYPMCINVDKLKQMYFNNRIASLQHL